MIRCFLEAKLCELWMRKGYSTLNIAGTPEAVEGAKVSPGC